MRFSLAHLGCTFSQFFEHVITNEHTKFWIGVGIGAVFAYVGINQTDNDKGTTTKEKVRAECKKYMTELTELVLYVLEQYQKQEEGGSSGSRARSSRGGGRGGSSSV